MTAVARVIEFPAHRRAAERVPLSELQARFGYSERWWRQRIAEPGFPRYRWGGQWRFDPAEVRAYLDGRNG